MNTPQPNIIVSIANFELISPCFDPCHCLRESVHEERVTICSLVSCVWVRWLCSACRECWRSTKGGHNVKQWPAGSWNPLQLQVNRDHPPSHPQELALSPLAADIVSLQNKIKKQKQNKQQSVVCWPKVCFQTLVSTSIMESLMLSVSQSFDGEWL